MRPQEQYKAETGKDIWEKKDYTHTLHYVEWMKNYVKNSNSKEAKMVLAFARKLQSYNDKTNSMTNGIDWQYFFGGSSHNGRSVDRYYKAEINGVRVEMHATLKSRRYSIGNIDKAKIKYKTEAELLTALNKTETV